MLKIHKPHTYKKLLTLGITSICGIDALLGLTYHPNLAHAETVTYEPPKETRTMADITYMQDINVDICTNTPEADTAGNNQYQLKDSRDQKIYWVAKLKDGNCWMTQNLKIINKPISSADSDMAFGNFTIPDSNVSGFIDNDQDQPKAYYEAPYGGYYNWYTATAGSGTSSVTSGNASSSICPKGWRLPPNTGNGSYTTLFNSYGTYRSGTLFYGNQSIIAPPLSFVGGGYVSNSSLRNTGNGYYRSSTANGTNNIYGLNFSNSVNPSSGHGRYYGMSVRCVARTESIPNNNVEITINNTISLDVASEIKVEKSDTNPSAAALPISVASNQPYSVSISSINPNFTSTTSSAVIPSTSGTLTSATNAWGIKKLNNDKSATSQYSAITTSSQTFYTGTTPESATLSFPIGISTSPNLPNGEYSINITITATQN